MISGLPPYITSVWITSLLLAHRAQRLWMHIAAPTRYSCMKIVAVARPADGMEVASGTRLMLCSCANAVGASSASFVRLPCFQ